MSVEKKSGIRRIKFVGFIFDDVTTYSRHSGSTISVEAKRTWLLLLHKQCPKIGALIIFGHCLFVKLNIQNSSTFNWTSCWRKLQIISERSLLSIWHWYTITYKLSFLFLQWQWYRSPLQFKAIIFTPLRKMMCDEFQNLRKFLNALALPLSKNFFLNIQEKISAEQQRLRWKQSRKLMEMQFQNHKWRASQKWTKKDMTSVKLEKNWWRMNNCVTADLSWK